MATEQIQDEIHDFFAYFRKVLAYYQERLTPESRSPANYELLPGKMACCALLDALSVARFPNGEQGKRFRKLVGCFSKYEYWDHVSIPQLCYNLQRSVGSGHERLMKHAEVCLASRQGYAITDDPLCSELVNSFPGSKEKIESFRHLFLFYKYRCVLVHESRKPGSGYESEDTAKPCYQGVTENPTGKHTFQLTYPLKFFFSVCDECIDGLEDYFLREGKSPLKAYERRFGDAWR